MDLLCHNTKVHSAKDTDIWKFWTQICAALQKANYVSANSLAEDFFENYPDKENNA
jgi:outer membrane protein assembly factor BamD (BamD/ComL family)